MKAKFFESVGAVKEGEQFALDLNLPVGKYGICSIEQWTGNDGNLNSSVHDTYKPSQRPAVTMNEGLPFDQQA